MSFRRSPARSPRRDKDRSLSELGAHCRGMLAQTRNMISKPLALEYRRGGWQQDRPIWGVDRDPPEMRMMRKILDCVEVSKGDFGGFQPLSEGIARITREFCGDSRVNLGPVRHAPIVVAETGVVG